MALWRRILSLSSLVILTACVPRVDVLKTFGEINITLPYHPNNDVLAPMFQTVNCLGRCLLLVLLQAAMESKANSTESQSTTYHERLLLIQITEKFLLLLAETIVSYLI